MKITVKIGVLFALLWIAFKFAYHAITPDTTELKPSIFANMFLLLTSISLGLYLHKKKEGFKEGNALSDIKAAMTSGFPYAVIVSVFMYFYYNSINPNFIQSVQKPFIEQLKQDVSTDKKVNELKRLHPELETKTKKQIYASGLENIKGQTNPKSTSIISLLALMLLSTIYSILITTVYRRVLFRKM
jgi:hypothetical protein